MANETNMCESIEIALLSDIELTDEQKNHIENCQNCKALLSNIEKMKNDLGLISVPGIEEGQITASVMKEIRTAKTITSTKFKWTNHLGTIAAAVIILVTALIIKNPVNEINSKNNDALIVKDEQSDEELLIPHENLKSEPSENEDTKSDGTQEAYEMGAVQEKVRSKNSELVFDIVANPNAYNDGIITDKQNTATTVSENELTNDTFDSKLSLSASDDVADAETNDFILYSVQSNEQEAIQDKSEVTDESDYGTLLDVNEFADSEDCQETAGLGGSQGSNLAFSDVEFLDGEENFDANIERVNEALSQKYPEYKLTKEFLANIGINTNQAFVEKAKSLTNTQLRFIIIMIKAKTSN